MTRTMKCTQNSKTKDENLRDPPFLLDKVPAKCCEPIRVPCPGDSQQNINQVRCDNFTAAIIPDTRALFLHCNWAPLIIIFRYCVGVLRPFINCSNKS